MKTFQIKTTFVVTSIYRIGAKTKEEALKCFENRNTTRIESGRSEESIVEFTIISTDEPQEKDVHTEHCCLTCGCKYGNEDCSITTGRKMQSFPHREDCHW